MCPDVCVRVCGITNSPISSETFPFVYEAPRLSDRALKCWLWSKWWVFAGVEVSEGVGGLCEVLPAHQASVVHGAPAAAPPAAGQRVRALP